MNTFGDTGGDAFEWVKPRWTKLEFELRAGETVVATLAWSGGSRAVGTWADAQDDQYRFSREGWLRPRILVRRARTDAATATGDPDEPIAMFAYRGGALSFPDGRAFVWKKPKRLTTERVWVDRAATEIVRYRPARWHSTAAVTLQPAAAGLPELPLLILLGQYLVVLAAQDAVAASTAGTVAVIASS
jgi:hypothetical protein